VAGCYAGHMISDVTPTARMVSVTMTGGTNNARVVVSFRILLFVGRSNDKHVSAVFCCWQLISANLFCAVSVYN